MRKTIGAADASRLVGSIPETLDQATEIFAPIDGEELCESHPGAHLQLGI